MIYLPTKSIYKIEKIAQGLHLFASKKIEKKVLDMFMVYVQKSTVCPVVLIVDNVAWRYNKYRMYGILGKLSHLKTKMLWVICGVCSEKSRTSSSLHMT